MVISKSPEVFKNAKSVPTTVLRVKSTSAIVPHVTGSCSCQEVAVFLSVPLTNMEISITTNVLNVTEIVKNVSVEILINVILAKFLTITMSRIPNV